MGREIQRAAEKSESKRENDNSMRDRMREKKEIHWRVAKSVRWERKNEQEGWQRRVWEITVTLPSICCKEERNNNEETDMRGYQTKEEKQAFNFIAIQIDQSK